MNEDSLQNYSVALNRVLEGSDMNALTDVIGQGWLELSTIVGVGLLGFFEPEVRMEMIVFAAAFFIVAVRSHRALTSLNTETEKLSKSLHSFQSEIDLLLKDLAELKRLDSTKPPLASRGGSSTAEAPFCEDLQLSSHCWFNFYHGIEEDFFTSNHFTILSEQEKTLFKEIQSEFKVRYDKSTEINKSSVHTIPDNFTILRYLQSDKYDVNLALNRLISSIVWRQEIDIYSLVTNPIPNLDIYRETRVRAYMGLAKDGTPVFAERLGGFMCSIGKGRAKVLTDQDYLNCYIYTMGQFIQRFHEERKRNKNAGWKQMFVGDLKGVSIGAAYRSITLIKKLASQVETHFPEMAAEPIWLLNCPRIVTGAYNVLKPFLDPVIVAKIKMSSGVPTAEMLECMDEEVLFEEYGGKNTAPYPKTILN